MALDSEEESSSSILSPMSCTSSSSSDFVIETLSKKMNEMEIRQKYGIF